MKEKLKSDKLGARLVFNIVTFGFIGQVAWAVENNYFNLFLYKRIGGDSDDIALMVACSAVVAVITTLIMGTLSDKLNRRKAFISGGYILWGFTVIAFAAISRENTAKLMGITDLNSLKLISVTVGIVIAMDCLMTFMGSTSNDAAFNAWITDVTNERNRAKTEGILAILPVIAMVLVTVAFAAGVDKVGYPKCFIALGALVVACGVLGLFTITDSRSGIKNSNSNFWADIFYGFRPSVVKQNKSLYLALSSMGIFAIATQVFFPYLFIYVGQNLGLGVEDAAAATESAESAGMPWWIYLAAAAAVAVVIGGAVSVGSLIDKMGKAVFVFPASAVFIVGLVLVFFAKSLIPFALLAVIMLVGYGLLMIILGAAIRDFTPEDKVGQFQGIRMIFSVLLPMVIGPAVGSFVTKNFATKMYENDYQELVAVPPAHIFLAAAIIAVFIFIPLAALKKQWKAKETAAKAQ